MQRSEDIQFLRGVAIAAVLLAHVGPASDILNHLPIKPVMPLYMGVELFFVISGYVVTHSVFDRPLTALGFLVRRAFRLFPAILAFLCFSGLASALIYYGAKDADTGKSFISSVPAFTHEALTILTGTFTLFSPHPTFYNGPMWSLSVEFEFYAAYTLCLAFIIGMKRVFSSWNIKNSRINPQRIMMGLSLVLFAICLARRFGFLFGIKKTTALLDYIVGWRFDFLFFGVIMASWPRLKVGEESQKKLSENALFLSPLLLFTPFVLAMTSESAMSGWRPFLDGFTRVVAVLCFGLLVRMAGATNIFPATTSRTYLFLQWLGDRSFSIYLFHFPVLAFVWFILYKLWPSLFLMPRTHSIIQPALVFLLTFVVSDLCYKHIEKPFNKIGAKLSSKLARRVKSQKDYFSPPLQSLDTLP